MIISFEGRDWVYDQEKISVQQGIAMFQAWGFTLETWEEALKATDPRAMQCLYWHMLAQNGVTKPLRECDFDMAEFAEALGNGADAERAARAAARTPPPPEPAAEPGPTLPAGPLSPGPPSPPDTTLTGPGAPPDVSVTA
jgi:hypothetical protein